MAGHSRQDVAWREDRTVPPVARVATSTGLPRDGRKRLPTWTVWRFETRSVRRAGSTGTSFTSDRPASSRSRPRRDSGCNVCSSVPLGRRSFERRAAPASSCRSRNLPATVVVPSTCRYLCRPGVADAAWVPSSWRRWTETRLLRDGQLTLRWRRVSTDMDAT